MTCHGADPVLTPRARAAARHAPQLVSLSGYTRDPRIRALVDRRGQRLRPAGDGPLSRPPRRGAAQEGRGLSPLPDHLGRRTRPRSRPPARSRSGWSRSGPAGGAILAAALARQCGLDKVLSFDMGGTTAKICLIDNWRAAAFALLRGRAAVPLPQGQRPAAAHSRHRDGRNRRGWRLDRLRRFACHACNVGPESAGAEPGPAELRPRRRRAHRDRRRRRAGPHRSRLLRRRLDQALARQWRATPSTSRSARQLGLQAHRRGRSA